LADVAHSTLTGAELHENKGVASASDNTVATADSGATVWQKLTADHLTGTGNSFGAQYCYIRDQKSNGTNGGAFNSGDWRTRTLTNIVTNEIGASLNNSQVTLPAGTYFCIASAPAYDVGSHKAIVINVTDNSTLLSGTSENTAASCTTRSWCIGRFTLSGTKDIEVQHRCSASRAVNGFGINNNFGLEIYTELHLWKIA
jgi:hypothetical protein